MRLSTRPPSYTKPSPTSCDTFVALFPDTNAPPTTPILFAKNSDRPDDEVQEVLTLPSLHHPPNSTLKCTYITIPQVSHTRGVIISKPTWMWGAEMAANDAGVVIGNEAVWTNEPDDGPEALLGMDLVRLAAERGGTAAEAVEIIAELLSDFGQGGGCEEGGSWSYHNSFLIADRTEAWVMETAGRYWVAEKVTQGVRNISNCLSIRTTIHKGHPDLLDHCTTKQLQSAKATTAVRTNTLPHLPQDPTNENQLVLPDGSPLDWAATFSSGGAPPPGSKTPGREASGLLLLLQHAQKSPTGTVTAPSMMEILRDTASGICMCGGGFTSTGSQVSVIQPPGSNLPDVHWFTATPDPSKSAFKPFIFPPLSTNTTISLREIEADSTALQDTLDGMPSSIESSTLGSELTEAKSGDGRVHVLWAEALQARRAANKAGTAANKKLRQGLQEIENEGLGVVEKVLNGVGNGKELLGLFDRLCRKEAELYKRFIA